MFCFMQTCFESNNFMASVNFPMLSFMTPWFICLVVCEEWKETWLCIWQDAILALWALSQDCAGFDIHLHSKEFLHQIRKGFHQKNIQSQIFKLYIRQIEKSGKATSLNRYIRNKELRKWGDWEQVSNVRSHCHVQWSFRGWGIWHVNLWTITERHSLFSSFHFGDVGSLQDMEILKGQLGYCSLFCNVK